VTGVEKALMLQSIRVSTLVLTVPLLLAAAEPPSPCGQSAVSEQGPAPLAQPGAPLSRAPLLSTAIATPPSVDVASACASRSRQGGSSPNPRADALHALPTPEVTSVMPSRPGD
jgi:hypothetical protein